MSVLNDVFPIAGASMDILGGVLNIFNEGNIRRAKLHEQQIKKIRETRQYSAIEDRNLYAQQQIQSQYAQAAGQARAQSVDAGTLAGFGTQRELEQQQKGIFDRDMYQQTQTEKRNEQQHEENISEIDRNIEGIRDSSAMNIASTVVGSIAGATGTLSLGLQGSGNTRLASNRPYNGENRLGNTEERFNAVHY